MNTMPQAFDPRPMTRAATQAGFSVSGPAAARRPQGAHLTLVGQGSHAVSAAMSPAVAAVAASMAAPAAAAPYDLSARRHLARVPERAQPAGGSQAATPRADNPGTAAAPARTPARLPLEPLVFALVLLVSVAALAVAMRAG